MALADDLAYMGTAALSQKIRRRELSPVEVVEAAISRIEERNPSLNAFVYFGFEDARKQAALAERQLVSGEDVGPLHGVPTALKDLFDFKPGWVTTFGGVRALKDHVADHYCAFAERIEQAGAIIVGKTNSPVMGFRGTTDNGLFGRTHNPFNMEKNSGGSSGGSAAAVADGLLSLAEGTDGGGSIRIPAAWCGVYGYKPSFGRVPYLSRPNAFGGGTPFLFEGPIARSVEDAALAMTALAGYDPRDPFCLDEDIDFIGALAKPVRDWKIAYSPDLDVFPVDGRIADVVGTAVRAFEEAGAHVEEVKVGITRSQRELSDLWCRLIMLPTIFGMDGLKDSGVDLLKDHVDDFPPEFLRWVEVGRGQSAQDVLRDQAARSEVYDALQGILNDYDLLVTPTVACLPVDNASDGTTKGPGEINGESIDPLIGWCLTYPVNFTGHPAASIPAGLVDGLPVGMQIIGRRYADTDVIAASAAFERLRPWRDSYRICRERAL